ncbi:MAG: glycosyltransferase [Nitrospirae bacterium]|nr:glycosyltransferase [Nitrospirota bacterium]
MRNKAVPDIRSFVSGPLFDDETVLSNDPSYPRITVVTPSFNQSRYIERTILSVLNQNYPNLEYIIIDGGSTDGSIDIIRKYERYLACWVSEKDEGQADAINKGLKLGTGDLFAWQNSDDLYMPGAFMTVAEKFRERPDSAVFFGNFWLVDSDDEPIRDIRFTPFSFRCSLLEGIGISNQAAFWRRELFEEHGYLDPSLEFAMDLDWWLRLGHARAGFCFIRRHLGCLRIHEETKTSTILNDVGLAERIEIRRGYSRGIPGRVSTSFWKTICLLRRTGWYVLQGDFFYLFRGVPRRMRNLLAARGKDAGGA